MNCFTQFSKYPPIGWIAVCILMGISCKSPQEVHRAPNIVFLYADDLGWTDLGVQGSDYYETPHLDRLASESIVFTNAYANAANCAPSRACLMTGLYPPRHGIYTVANSDRGKSVNRKLIPIENTTTLDKRFTTLAQSLKAAGYATCVAGKWHLSDDPTQYGFDTNFGGTHAGHPKSYFSPYQNQHLSDGPEGEHLPERLSREVANWITEHQAEPFFVYFPFYSVHTPVQAREDIKAKYDSKSPGTFHNHSGQAAMIEAMDLAVGTILATLEASGLADNTIVIFSSDNGPAGGQSSAQPLRGTKGMYYEGGIREPLFVKWPGVTKAGRTEKSPVIATDLYPTLLEMANAPSPDFQLDGASIVPLLQGDTIADRALFWHFPAYLQMSKGDRAFEDSHDKPHFRTSPCSAIRKGDWKLIEYFENGEIELYNLTTDLSETTNLASREPEKAKELLDMLKAWRAEVGAPVPTALNPKYLAE